VLDLTLISIVITCAALVASVVRSTALGAAAAAWAALLVLASVFGMERAWLALAAYAILLSSAGDDTLAMTSSRYLGVPAACPRGRASRTRGAADTRQVVG
jgi:hypothetical protein